MSSKQRDRPEAPVGRDETHFQRYGFAPSLAWGIGTDTKLTLSYLYYRENNIPDYGLPADQRTHDGHQAVHEREAALALWVRVAVHDSRQNDRNPVIWQPGQDYRMADAIHAARHQPTRTRLGPERLGLER